MPSSPFSATCRVQIQGPSAFRFENQLRLDLRWAQFSRRRIRIQGQILTVNPELHLIVVVAMGRVFAELRKGCAILSNLSHPSNRLQGVLPGGGVL